MRWKGFIFLVVVSAIIAVISIFFMDGWIESGLESAGEAIVGAKVEIDDLHFSLFRLSIQWDWKPIPHWRFVPTKGSLFDLSIQWDRLQVTDPDHTLQNILETGRTAFRMNAPALFRKRYVIEEMTLADIRSGTPRKTDGALPKEEEPPKTEPDALDKMQAKLKDEIAQLPVMNFDLERIKSKLNLDSLLVMADLQIVNRVDSARTDLNQTADRWSAFYKGFHPDEELSKIKTDFADLDPKQIKTLPEVLSTLDKIKTARKSLTSITDTIQVNQAKIRQDFDRASTYAKDADDWIKADYQNLLKKAQLPDLSVKNIGKILFGQTIVNRINQYLGYLQMIRKYMPRKSAEAGPALPERLTGRDIYFPDFHGWPRFLIRKIHVSGQTGVSDEAAGFVMSGDITGITSQPWIYGKPTVIDLKALQQDKLSGIFVGMLDHTTDVSSDSFNLVLRDKSLNAMQIAHTPYLPSEIKNGKADFNAIVRFEESNLLVRMDIQARGLDFSFPEAQTRNRFVSVVRDVISGIDLITLHAQAAGKADELDFKLDSNLDELITARLKQIGSQALTDAQNKIRDRLNKIRDSKMQEINALYAARKKDIVDKIEDYKSRGDEIKTRIETKVKEVEAEIEQRKKAEENKLKDKASGKLQDLLKGKKNP